MKKILLVISLISVLLLAGCNKNENIDNVNIPENTDNQQQEIIENKASIDENESEKSNPEEKKVIVDLDNLVEDAYTKKDEYRDTITIPHINIESEDVDKINKDFDDFISKINEDVWINGEKYFYFVNNNVLTLVTESIYDRYAIDDAKVYHIDLNNGKLLSNNQIMSSHGITDDTYQLNKILKNTLAKEWDIEQKRNIDTWEWIVEYYDNRIDTLDLRLSEEKFYFDDNNELHVFFSVPYVAGPSGNHYIDVKI